jgi:hypothetical protein
VWAENPFADRVSPDRRWWYLGWAGESPELKVFDVQNRRVDVLPIVGSGEFYWFAYSPNSRFMIVENDVKGGHELVVWDLPERRIRHTLRGQRTPIDVSPDNQLLAALVWDEKSPQIIQVTDLESGRIVETIRDTPQERGYHLRFSGDGSLLAAIATHTITAKIKSGVSDPEACRARLLGSWRVPGVHRSGFPTNRHDRFVTVPYARSFMTYEPTNDEMYVVTRDMVSGEIQRQLWVHNAPMGFFEPYFLTPNGEMMIAQGLDSRITYLERLAMHFKVPLKRDATGYKSESHIYKTASGRHVCDIPGWNPIWSPDGRTIAVNLANQCPDGEVELWDVPPAKQVDWFAVGAALIGLPIIPIAWLRARMLRSA